MGAFRAPAKTEALSVADITTAHGMSGHRALPLERQREPQTRHTNSPITREDAACAGVLWDRLG